MNHDAFSRSERLQSITLLACAKINLSLDVLSKREDGYHNLASVFQTVGLADRLTLRPTEDSSITLKVSGGSAPVDRTNLAYRAAEAAIQAALVRPERGISIELEKRIPSEAGLGGGSSDAAAALAGTNSLLALGLSMENLMDLAAGLGSDVPFFLLGGTVTARGRGERLTQLPAAPELWLVLVKPECSVSTAWAYRELAAIPDRQSARATGRVEESIREGDRDRLVSRLSNDFERVVMEEGGPLAQLMDDMRMARCENVRLCGSGSAMFGVCPHERSAQESARLLGLRYNQVWVCKTLTSNESSAIELAKRACHG